MLVLYAQPGGSVEQLCREALALGKPVFALPGAHNAHLFKVGAQAWLVD